MYQNAGRSIKSVVSIIVKIGYTFSIIGAVLIFLAGLSTGETGIVIAAMFGAVIVGGLGCLSAWLSGLWLYAYGEITDRLISIDERLYHANLDGRTPAKPAAPVAPVAPAAPAAPANAASIFCTACGTRNEADAIFCTGCGAELTSQAAQPSASTTNWKCTCGRVNSGYVSSCPCGRKRQ